MFSGVFVGGDFSADGVKPFISVGVVEMPMSVDQMSDRVGTEAIECFHDSGPRRGDPRVNQQLAVVTREHNYISARAFQHADIPAKLLNSDFGCGRRSPHGNDGAFLLGEYAARQDGDTGCNDGSGDEKMTPGAVMQCINFHRYNVDSVFRRRWDGAGIPLDLSVCSFTSKCWLRMDS